jgi:aspartyl-tRNA(Asn)/glutamyl-tRNA(Gln) amidotransferase subunit A
MLTHKTSATHRLEAALEKIAAPDLQGGTVFTEVFQRTARQEAQAADARAAQGQSLGRLDGRIVSVKALFDVAGSVTTAGSVTLRGQRPAERDAAAIARLRAAGAVIIGKTQMTEFAFSALGTNIHDGTPGNPRARDRAPGGSSSGAVISVVDSMAEIAIGSDTGGSIRIPSALSGAVGFKPTQSRVPLDGAFSLSSSLDTIGPIAATVEDCAVADAILSGLEASSTLVPAPIDSFQLSIARGYPFDACEPAIADSFERTMRLLQNAGVRTAESSLKPHLDALAQIDKIGTFPSIEVAATLAALGISDLEAIDPNTRVRIEAGGTVSAVDYVRMTRLREAAIAAFDSAIEQSEIYVIPTTPICAPLLSSIEESKAFHACNGLILRNPRIANLLDCPSISLPMPKDGLPAGLMLIGKRHSDRRLLSVALRLEELLLRS